MSIKQKIEAIGTPLKDWDIQINYGIKTGFNDAFIIDGKKRAELIAADPKSAEIIRPILRGRDIKRYNYDFADLWLINTHNGIKDKGISRINIDDYPAIKEHLDQYWEQISTRTDKGDTPYNLRNCAYMDDFNKQKIVWGEISDRTKFCLDYNGEFYCEATTFLMTGESLPFLVCYLNSSLSEYLFSLIGTTTGVGTVRWKKFKIEQLYIPKCVPDHILSEIQTLSDQIYDTPIGPEKDEMEKHINQLVLSIFDLTPEEIKIIERN